MAAPNPSLYLNSPEYHALLAKYDPAMPGSYQEYERFVRRHVQGKEYRRKYRKSEKGREVLRKHAKRRRERWKARIRELKEIMQQPEFKEYIKDKESTFATAIRPLGLSAAERKREYNRERQRRIAKMKRLHFGQRIKVYGENIGLAPAPAPVAEYRPAPAPTPEEEAAALEREIERDIKDQCNYWRIRRQDVIDTIAAIRAQGQRINAETAPDLMNGKFRYIPIHLRKGDAPACAQCGCLLQTPLGDRRSDDDENQWFEQPFRCEILEDIPNEVFWPRMEEQTND